jgi:hypothetical protein
MTHRDNFPNTLVDAILYFSDEDTCPHLDDAYVHEVIDHAESYVRGHVHTNGLENFWSIFKRTVYGTHHCVDPVHLDLYLGETAYRFNTRDEKDSQRFTDVVSRIAGKRLTWKELTA